MKILEKVKMAGHRSKARQQSGIVSKPTKKVKKCRAQVEVRAPMVPVRQVSQSRTAQDAVADWAPKKRGRK
ncbi:MAG: hypothetical protein RBR71_12100 [Gudongella sp.]|nr:hypothetical protein [Gudongella sp.]